MYHQSISINYSIPGSGFTASYLIEKRFTLSSNLKPWNLPFLTQRASAKRPITKSHQTGTNAVYLDLSDLSQPIVSYELPMSVQFVVGQAGFLRLGVTVARKFEGPGFK